MRFESPNLTLCHFKDMQGKAISFDGRQAAKRTKPVVSKQSHASAPYQKVLDGRKRPIRGLWQRGTRFYARLVVEELIGRAP